MSDLRRDLSPTTWLPCIALVMAWLAFCIPVSAENVWPTFRGPSGDGHAANATLPDRFEENHIQWSTPIHGKGWSSPVVWGDQIWLTTATEDGKEMSVLCVDRKTGDIVIDRVVKRNAEPAFCHKMNSYASPTPIVTKDHVFVHFGSYLTACLDKRNGQSIWERTDLECDHHRGPASSPILHDGKLFVAYDGFDVQYVAALDAKSGQTVWKRDRKIDYGTDNGDWMKAYCTGQMVPTDQGMELVYPSASATIAYDPTTGKENWRVYHGGMNASARPVFDQQRVYITNGMGAMVAVELGGTGDVTSDRIVWESKKSIAKKSSQLLLDGILYMISDDGIATARDGESGDIHWQKRLDGEYAASPVYADGKIYFFSRDGDITTIEPGDSFRRIAVSKIGSGFMASPAVVGNELIVRSIDRLYLLK